MLYLVNHTREHTMETRRALLAVDGYLFFNMAKEASAELGSIPHKDQHDPDVLLAQIRVLLHLKKWGPAEMLSARGSSQYPEEDEFTVQRAFALHQMHKGEMAMDVLLSAPDWLRRTGILHYNLACYEARLGDLSIARKCMNAAIRLNSSIKKNARIDPDLWALWS